MNIITIDLRVMQTLGYQLRTTSRSLVDKRNLRTQCGQPCSYMLTLVRFVDGRSDEVSLTGEIHVLVVPRKTNLENK